VPIVGFVVGIVIVEESARHRRHRALGFLLVFEVALLSAFMVWAGSALRAGVVQVRSRWELDALILLPWIALGLQTAAVRRAGGQTTRTVYVTGMLTRSTEEAVRLLHWRRDHARDEVRLPWRNEPTMRRVALVGGLIFLYSAGALLGAWGNTRWPAWSLLVPIVSLVLVVTVDRVAYWAGQSLKGVPACWSRNRWKSSRMRCTAALSQASGRFVGEQQGRCVRERPSDRDRLAFPVGQLRLRCSLPERSGEGSPSPRAT
jgi:uncharacterized membrane protein YoaK (UPF0700 family)